jgi:putative endonuclease
MKRGGTVYIVTNKIHTTLYTGFTSDLKKRIYEHENNIFPDSFTAKYKTYILVYFEGFHRIEDAITREKQIKASSWNNKVELITLLNPDDVLLW